MIKVNLLPIKTRKKSAHGDLILFVVMLVVGFGSVGAVYFKNVKDISNTRSEIARSKEAVVALQGVYKDYETIQREKKEIERRISVIDDMKAGRALAARILYDLPSIMRDNVWLKRFKKDGGLFELEGRSLENESIAEFVERLSKTPYYRNVELKNIEDVTEEGVVVKKFIVQGGVGL
jgi:type IV pilus assembly protein PilN